jgi:hypothetical protein
VFLEEKNLVKNKDPCRRRHEVKICLVFLGQIVIPAAYYGVTYGHVLWASNYIGE